MTNLAATYFIVLHSQCCRGAWNVVRLPWGLCSLWLSLLQCTVMICWQWVIATPAYATKQTEVSQWVIISILPLSLLQLHGMNPTYQSHCLPELTIALKYSGFASWTSLLQTPKTLFHDNTTWDSGELESYTYTPKGFWIDPVESEIGAALRMPSVLTAISDTKHLQCMVSHWFRNHRISEHSL